MEYEEEDTPVDCPQVETKNRNKNRNRNVWQGQLYGYGNALSMARIWVFKKYPPVLATLLHINQTGNMLCQSFFF
jgi:hypothetical protein